MHDLDLSIADISKIEGKASCEIKVREGKVTNVSFSIAEYKRFYTQAIRGKDIAAIPQLTARICGTCSNAHLICALKAAEDSQDINVTDQTVNLRKLVNFGLIIRDHTLHLNVFVLPDLFNRDSILDFDENDPIEHQLLDDTFAIKAAGNHLSIAVGGRSVHAPFLTVGGFTKIPSQDSLLQSYKELELTRPKVLEMIRIFAEKDFRLEMDNIEYAALVDDKYSFLSGELVRSDGSTVLGEKYGDYLEHVSIPYSHASGYKFAGKVYMTGALARINLAKKFLNEKTQKDVKPFLSMFPSKNIFHNNLAQAIEVLHAIDSSLEIIDKLKIVVEKPVVSPKKAGTGIGIIEAPRGALYYKLEVAKDGKVIDGRIVVPTGQNQIFIEECIRKYLEENINQLTDREMIEHEVEKIVRAFDPCMSCASHFLKFKYV